MELKSCRSWSPDERADDIKLMPFFGREIAEKERIVSATDEKIKARLARGEIRTDWVAFNALSQTEVERLADEKEGPLPDGLGEDRRGGLSISGLGLTVGAGHKLGNVSDRKPCSA